MGCYQNCQKSLNQTEIQSELLSCFVLDNLLKFKTILNYLKNQKPHRLNINKYTIQAFSNKSLTLPALSIIYGRTSFFKYMCESFSLSLVQLDTFLNSFKVSALFFLCSKNYCEFLSYFLPLYIAQSDSFVFRSSYTLSFADHSEYETLTTYTPLQIACECGYLNIIKISFEFFKDMDIVPVELDVNFIDPATGDNCALIACKKNNYALIKFLHNACNADFTVKNNNKENALQLACLAYKDHKDFSLYSVCKYLVEEVGIDISYNYEETIILCDDNQTYEYLQMKLLGIGITVSKADFDEQKLSFEKFVSV